MTSLSAFLTLALGAGCTVDDGSFDGEPTEETLGMSEDALVGGSPTLLYPEIGQYIHQLAGSAGTMSCTATLFAPRYVITAAHCVSYTDITVRAGEKFVITDILGNTHDYAVDKIATFGNGRYEYTPGTSLTTDIAILRLTTPVPASVAAPRALASSLPANAPRVSTSMPMVSRTCSGTTRPPVRSVPGRSTAE